MKEAKRHTITAALPYANGPLHLGHLAGCYLPADIYSRYLKAKGKDVLFVCGSDEHGAAITLRAKKEGTTPQAIVDKNHGIIEYTREKVDDELNEKDRIIYTSGFAGLFRSGIPVGRMFKKSNGQVNFFSKFTQLEYVKIVAFDMESQK